MQYSKYSTYFKGKNIACPEVLSAYKQIETETECLIICSSTN